MSNRARKNNQERKNQVAAHQKKVVDRRRQIVANGGFLNAVPRFRANNKKRGKE